MTTIAYWLVVLAGVLAAAPALAQEADFRMRDPDSFMLREATSMRLAAFTACFVLLALTVSAQAQTQQCGKGQMLTPNGCMQVCGPGYSIGKDASGFNTCLRDGNQEVGTHAKKYAFLPIAAGNNVDGICFGIRPDERVETVVDDRFVEADWHVQPNHAYVVEISYTLDPGLTKLHLTGFRYWRADANRKPIGAGDMIAADAVVPLYDAPQANWPCTQQQWATIMTPPKIVAVPPDYGDPYKWHPSGPGRWKDPRCFVPGPAGSEAVEKGGGNCW